jgi:protein translocase SecG subunit
MLAVLSNIFFVIICSLMIALIMIQQSRGEIGFGAAPSKGTQLVFGGSGGQEFFEKVTWVLGATFLLSCLAMSYFQSKEQSRSILESYQQVIGKSGK